MKILFFIESLRAGGKERRLLELIHYLEASTDYEMLLVLTDETIHYNYVYQLQTEIKIIKRRHSRKDLGIFFKFYKLCSEFKPDVIHTWGSMLSFYAIPAVVLKKIPHINSHIADVPIRINKFDFHYFVIYLGFMFSTIILSNTYAGLQAYGLYGKKCRVIYNGIRLERFIGLPDKRSVRDHFNIRTPFAVIMVASFSSSKNYDQFLDIAEYLMPIRNDITFLGVGGPSGSLVKYEKMRKRAEKLENVILCGQVDHVEALVNACDIGVLFSYSEGLSNSILEYMACGKPVIASSIGGNREVVTDGQTGFLITNESTAEIARILTDLLDNEEKRMIIGENGKSFIQKHFALDRMGSDFVELYKELVYRN